MDYDVSIDIPFTLRLENGKALRFVKIVDNMGTLGIAIKHLTEEEYTAMMSEVDSATSR